MMIFCVNYVQIHFLMCLMMKKQILDSESDIPTTSSHEQL